MQGPAPINVVILGCTGSGKSRFCNALIGSAVFKVSTGFARETHKTQAYFSPDLNLNVIDTYGFGDTSSKAQEAQMAAIFNHLRRREVIDAFVLVAPCNPRPSTLMSDLNCLINRFGTAAYRSLLVAFVDVEHKNLPQDQFDEQVTKMDEVVTRFKQAGVNFTSDRFFQWDSEKPRGGQTQELLKKIANVEKYDTIRFLEAAQERRERQTKEIEARIQHQLEEVKAKHAESLELQQKEVHHLQAKLIFEKGDLVKRLELQNRAVLDSIVEQLLTNKQEKEELSKMIHQVQKSNEQTFEKLAKIATEDREKYTNKMIQYIKLQDQTNLQMVELMHQVAQKRQQSQKDQRKGLYTHFFTEIGNKFKDL